MDSLNVFRTIEKTTHRIEPFHSQFLGDALRASLKGDRILFDRVWNLCTPADWKPPQYAKVKNEFEFEDGKKIDILIKDKNPNKSLRYRVGIEVKTSRASARAGQLEAYFEGLKSYYAVERIALAYLTPFNRRRAKEIIKAIDCKSEEMAIQGDVGALSTVKLFDDFCDFLTRKCHVSLDSACHVSWLDVAEIEWDACEAWHQHQSYVQNEMVTREELMKALSRNRSFDKFFSEKAVRRFEDCLWDALPNSERHSASERVILDLTSFEGGSGKLAKALTFLIEDDENVVHRVRENRIDEELRQRFLGSESPCRQFHKALFDLSCRFKHVWLRGKHDYGLCVAHKDHLSGVSLVTSQGKDRLVIGQRR